LLWLLLLGRGFAQVIKVELRIGLQIIVVVDLHDLLEVVDLINWLIIIIHQINDFCSLSNARQWLSLGAGSLFGRRFLG